MAKKKNKKKKEKLLYNLKDRKGNSENLVIYKFDKEKVVLKY